MRTFVDQTSQTITIPDSPRRIISLVPSQTELLSDLGLTEEVVGITKFCIHPEEWFRSKTRVGGTKELKLDLIRSLKPDLVIANKEENDQAQVQQLSGEFPVWVSNIKTLQEAKQMILSIGEMTNRFFEAVSLLKKIDLSFDELNLAMKEVNHLEAAYFIWNKPMMVAGGDTFISRMINAAGYRNAFRDLHRYPEVTDEQVMARHPEVIFLSSEPFPFGQKHVDEFRQRFSSSRVICVDGELFSWYGSRLQYAPGYFLKLFEQIETVK